MTPGRFDKSHLDMKVSVVITCYNLEKYITRAIHSCINQSLPEQFYEIIVVDDHSTDYSWERINEFDFITTIRHDENKGVASASNTGIRASTGDYVVRVDGDDFVNKNFLFSMSEVLNHNDSIGFVYCDYVVVREGNQRTLEINTLDKLLDHGAGVMFRKKYLESIGLYDEKYKNCEDFDLLLRYMKNFDGYHLRLPYYRYYKENGLSSRLEERTKLKREILEKQHGN